METEQVMEKDFIGTLRWIFESKLFEVGKTEITLLVILEVILAIIVFYVISRILRRFLKRQILSHFGIGESAKFAILRLSHYIIMLIGIIIALNAVGIQLTSLMVGLGVLGVGFAFGLQNITSNFISGIILLFERHVNVGDFVSVGNVIGQVKSIRIRSTTILTLDNIMLIVPNSKFIEDVVTNWSVDDPKIRISVPVGVAYGSDTDLVTKLLLKAAEDHEEVLTEPVPTVQFNEFGDSSLNFELLPWISNALNRKQIISDLNYEIDRLFRENGITIPFPQRDVHFYPNSQK
jgi:potassium-dependent mechanosensitive channel